MAQEDVYFQFPISALRFGKPINEVGVDLCKERHNAIIGYCMVDYGLKNWGKVSNAQGIAVDYKTSHKANGNPIEEKARTVYFACAKLNIYFTGDGKQEWRDHATIAGNTNGGTQIVRLRSDLFWQCEDFGWRDWTVLCAVYAALGNHPFMRFTYDRINALALGYNSVRNMERCEFERLKLTDRKMKTTTDKLIERGFFSKLSPNRRHNYWSWRPLEELKKMLLDDQLKKLARKQKTEAAANTADFRNTLEQLAKR